MMNLELQRKVEQSKRFLEKVISSMDNLYIANSGGKDSTVVYFLIKEMGVKLPCFHNVTTIDPDGTIGFIHTNMPDTVINRPKESFYDLIKRKAFPTRINRYCCEILKESGGIGKNTIEGVRASESTGRQGRDYIECDRRPSMQGAQHIYPIYDWLDADVWEYIKAKDLPIAPCYAKGMCRLGCIGCPQVTRKGARLKEFELYPRRWEACRNAIVKGMENNPQWKITRYTGGDGEKAMLWWLSGKSMFEYFGYELERVYKD